MNHHHHDEDQDQGHVKRNHHDRDVIDPDPVIDIGNDHVDRDHARVTDPVGATGDAHVSNDPSSMLNLLSARFTREK